jgi:cytochrome c oxidase subunit 4
MNSNRPTAKLYWRVWAGLLVLLFLTWGAATLHLGRWNIVVALTIAVVKMLLVVLFFMHVRYSPKLTAVFVAAGFFWLFLMMTLTMADYLSRGGFNF